MVERAQMSNEVADMINEDGNAGIYCLRLAADGESIEWVARGNDGKERAVADEPDHNWRERLNCG